MHYLACLQFFNADLWKFSSNCQDYTTLSLLFIIFAIATLFHPQKPAFSPEAHKFYTLSQAALNLSNPRSDTTRNITLSMIQTLVSSYLQIKFLSRVEVDL
jgi:hypothetical protein